MQIHYFKINNPLISLNKFIESLGQEKDKKGRPLGLSKKKYTTICQKSCLNMAKLEDDTVYYVVMHHVVPNKRTDTDNLAFRAKFVYDGMQWAGKIKNDGMKTLLHTSHLFSVDKEKEGISIYLIPSDFPESIDKFLDIQRSLMIPIAEFTKCPICHELTVDKNNKCEPCTKALCTPITKWDNI